MITTVSISISIKPDLLDRLDAYRKSLIVSPNRTHLINVAVQRYLDQEEGRWDNRPTFRATV